MTDLTRAGFLASGLRGGVALAAGGMTLGIVAPALAAGAAPEDVPPEEDLAIVRLAAAAELLAEDYYRRALASGHFGREERGYLTTARTNERDHYSVLARTLGESAPIAGDFQFSFPSKSFSSRSASAGLGVTLETAFVGAYLGAVEALQTPELRSTAAQIAASEAMHLSTLSDIRNGSPIGSSFPVALDIEQATDALAPYLGE